MQGCLPALVQTGLAREIGFKHRSLGEPKPPRQVRISLLEGPEILPGTPRGAPQVHERTPGDVKPTLHPGGEQVVANFFSCVHSGLQILGRYERTFLF